MRRRSFLSLLVYGPYFLLRHIWIQLSLLVAMFIAGAFIFAHYQGLDFLSALLGSVSTVTTIGIYAPNITAMPNTEKILLVVVFIMSVGSAASLVQGTVTAVFKKEFLMEELGEFRAKSMKGHVIVMGYRFLGRYVVDKLKELGLDFVVIARDESQVQSLRSAKVTAIAAPVTHSFEALVKAGVAQACALVATYDDDGDNMLAVLSAKKLNPSLRVITVVNEKSLAEGARVAQADVVVAPFDIVGQLLALSTVSKEMAGAFMAGKLSGRGIAEFEIRRSGIRVRDLDDISPVLLVLRKGQVLSNVGRQFVLEAGDTIYVLSDHELLVKFRTNLEVLQARAESHQPEQG